MILDIIAEDKSLITYRPKLNKLTGSIIATILLQQILFRWKLNGAKEFYKFKAPCKHPNYKENDSWTEELGMTIYEFDSAFKKLKELGLVSSRNTMDRKTFYSVDEPLLEASISEIYLNGKNQDRKVEKTHLVNGKNQDSITYNRDNTETTREGQAPQKQNNYELEKEIKLTNKQIEYLELVFCNPLFEKLKYEKFSNLTNKQIELEILQYAEGKHQLQFNSFIIHLTRSSDDKKKSEMIEKKVEKNKEWYGNGGNNQTKSHLEEFGNTGRSYIDHRDKIAYADPFDLGYNSYEYEDFTKKWETKGYQVQITGIKTY
jgi:hypothetical protein